MSVTARRVVYSLSAALGFAMIVPLAIRMRLWSGQVEQGPMDISAGFDPEGTAWLLPILLLALAGLVLATACLYAALTTGYPKAWRPLEDGRILCQRCQAEIGFGVARCPSCDQQLVW